MINLHENNLKPVDGVDLKLHHIGYACRDIAEALGFFKSLHNIKHISRVIYDPIQKANLCMLTIENSADIELVSGEPVKHLIDNGICIYHLCYETNNIFKAIDFFKQQGGVQLNQSAPAKLFNKKNIVFMQTKIGLIELLEKDQCILPNKLKHKIIVTGTFSVDSVRSRLLSLCERYHFPYEVEILSHDSMNIFLADKTSALNNNKINIIMLREQDFTDRTALKSEKLNDFINAFLYSASLKQSHFFLCICPSHPNYHDSENGLSNIKQLAQHENVSLINLDILTSGLEDSEIYDPIADIEAQVPYKTHFDNLVSTHVLKKIYAYYHNSYKVIIVDCDDTLWTGICGEDQIDSIVISDANILLQKKLLSLRERGFLICICSKNHEEDVRMIFTNHPDMILSDSDITAWQVNWDEKSSNLRALSNTLNLPISSFIFIDDNPLEIAKIENALGEILSIQFTNDLNELKRILDNTWAFDKERTATKSAERNEWYSAHIKRENDKANFDNIADFIKNLNIKININKATEADISRLVELSHRVTQFNFTNRKFDAHKLRTLINNDKTTHIFKVNLTDKHGDYGLVGLMMIDIAEHITIEAFLLSCRALNRHVEEKMLCHLVDFAKSLNINNIMLKFKQTSRNAPAKIFIETLSGNLRHINETEIALTIDTNTKLVFSQNSKKSTSSKKPIQHIQNSPGNLFIDKKAMFELLDLTTDTYSFNKDSINQNNSGAINTKNYLHSIWKEVLGLNSINDSDNFFHLGGDSLSALRLLSHVCDYFKVDIKLYEIFEYPTFFDLLNLIHSRLSSHSQYNVRHLPSLYGQPSNGTRDLSYNEKSLWLLDKLYGSSWFYNISSVRSIKGKLNIPALELAIHSVISNNSILRSSLSIENHKPIVIDSFDSPINFEVIQAEEMKENDLNQLISNIQLEGFNLHEAPLYRIRLLKRSDQDYILVLVFHHIIFDGWSEGLFNKQLQIYYRNHLSGTPVELVNSKYDYNDFIAWQKALYESENCRNSTNYWSNELKDFVPFRLSGKPTSTPNQKHQGRYHYFRIPDQLYISLNKLKHEHNTTLFVLLYSSFLILLHKYSNKNDITIGFPVSGRLIKELENIMGNFVSTLPIRSKINEGMKIDSVIQNSHKKITEAYENQFAPFQNIVNSLKNARSNADNPIYQVMIVLQDAPNQTLSLEDLDVDFFNRGYDAARMDLILEFNLISDSLDGGIYYDISLFDDMFIEKFIRDYIQTLESICSSEVHKVSNLVYQPVVSEPISAYKVVHDLFQMSASKFPHKLAVTDLNHTITYSELDNHANYLAAYLREKKCVQVNDIVILHLNQNVDVIICILACFKLGATYVPLDPNYPNEFKNQILNDCEAKLLITNTDMSLPIGDCTVSLREINLEYNERIQYQPVNECVGSDIPAYIIYTSGTTGKPKGVTITHGSIANLISALQPIYGLSENDNGLLFHSFCFDFSVWEIWSVLAYGGKLVISGNARQYSSDDFWNLILKEKITILNQTPSVFENFLLNSNINSIKDNISLRLIIFGGEPLYPKRLQPWVQVFGDNKPRLYNMYGITEVTVHASYQRITSNIVESNKSLIGKAIPGLEIELFNNTDKPANPNEEAEIYVSGAGLSSGYLNRADLTSRYFTNIKGKLWYKTGDLARKVGGNIEYLGRSGNYIKVRGFRITPNYVSSEVGKHPGIYKTTVFADNNSLLCLMVPNKTTAAPIINAIQCNRGQAKVNLTTLPNGMDIFQHNKSETLLQYQEIFQNHEYTKHGISLNKGDTVIDVGANIGMFSLFFGTQIENLKIYAFEPVPELYHTLKNNMAMCEIDATCINTGLSDKQKQCDFTYFPSVSVLSGINPNQSEVESLLKNTLAHKDDSSSTNHAEIIKASLTKKQISAEFSTLSNTINLHHIEHINLLKIDVERHELEVLKGINDEHWGLIDQVIIEVHDFDNRLDIISSLLASNGFIVNIERPSLIENDSIVVLYARKAHQITQPSNMDLRYRYKWQSKQRLENDVKAFTGTKLPNYMIPTSFLILDHIPTTDNGKIDFVAARKLFHNTALSSSKDKVSIEEQDSITSKLASCWKQVLNFNEYDHNTNFFDLGGDSFSLVTLHHLISEKITESIELMDLFTHTTIRQQAKYIKSKISGEVHD